MWFFWLIMGLMIVIALAFVCSPLLRPTTDLSTSKRSNQISVLLIIILLPIVAISLYLKWGASDQVNAWRVSQKNQKIIQQELAKYHGPQQLIDHMRTILENRPNSARGWYLLGRLYMSQNDFILANDAFAKANRLQPNQPATIVAYAESMFMLQNHLTSEVEKQLLHINRTMPNNPDIINLLALNAYNRHAYRQAIKYWEQLLNQYSPESEEGKALLDAIAKAQKLSR